MSFIALREDLENRVRDFIVDQYNWQCFARDNFNFETQTGPFEIAIRYMQLVDKYCIPETRRHGGMSISNDVHHLPEEEDVTGFEGDLERATVFTKVQWVSGYRSGTSEDYEYEFRCAEDSWFLDQVYLVTPRGRFECI